MWPKAVIGAALGLLNSGRLDAGELDHLGPLLGLIGDELAEVGGRARERRGPRLAKPRLYGGIGKRGDDDMAPIVLEFESWELDLRTTDLSNRAPGVDG